MDLTTDSLTCLREFAEHRSEPAFEALVRRYLPMVHATALRRCDGHSGLAAEISQSVFIDLSRLAGSLRLHVSLGGWLHQHTCFVASSVLRSERRREKRERFAMQDKDAQPADTDWSGVAPLLDASLLELSPSDRDPLSLRYFEELPYREIGERLGLNENTARMRVERALEKLRASLTQRGVTSTTAALAAGLTGHAVATPLATLTSAIVASVFVSSAVPPFSLATLIMSSAKLKTAFVTGLLACLSIPVWFQQRRIHHYRLDQAQLVARIAQLDRDRNKSQDEADRLRREVLQLGINQTELLKLRAQVGQLRRALERNVQVSGTANAGLDPGNESGANAKSFVVRDECTIPLRGSLVTGGWEIRPGVRSLMIVTPTASGESLQTVSVDTSVQIFEVNSEVLDAQNLRLSALDPISTQSLVMNAEEIRMLRSRLESADGVMVRSAPRVISPSGRKAEIHMNFGVPDQDSEIKFLPTHNPTDGTIHMSLEAQLGPFPELQDVSPNPGK